MRHESCPFLLDDETFMEMVRVFVSESRRRNGGKRGQKEYGVPALAFRRWMIDKALIHLDEVVIEQWLLERSQSVSASTVYREALRLCDFCRYLTTQNQLLSNPLQTLRDQHQGASFLRLAKALQEAGNLETLAGAIERPLSGVLSRPFHRYLQSRSRLGYQEEMARYTLASFQRYLRQRKVQSWRDVDTETIRQWQVWMGPAKGYLVRQRLVTLDGFFNFLLTHKAIARSPMPPIPSCQRRSESAYVFTREEIRQVIKAAEELPDSHGLPCRGPTYRMVYLLLYALGLRISEALNLRIQDIDFVENSVTIVKTKFNKGRVLPFGPRIRTALMAHLDTHPLLKLADRNGYLFPSEIHAGKHLHVNSCRHALQKLVKQVGIATDGTRRPPSLHSFRHSFAVHRVERWLREGTDLGLKLPLLSAFMGHVDVVATQVYLSMTPERLSLINRCFEHAFGKED